MGNILKGMLNIVRREDLNNGYLDHAKDIGVKSVIHVLFIEKPG